MVLSNIAAVWFVGSRQPGDTSLKLAMILVFFLNAIFAKKMWVLDGDDMDMRGPSWDLERNFSCFQNDALAPRTACNPGGGLAWRFSFLEAHRLSFPLTFTERSLLQVCERWQQVQKRAPCAQNQR